MKSGEGEGGEGEGEGEAGAGGEGEPGEGEGEGEGGEGEPGEGGGEEEEEESKSKIPDIADFQLAINCKVSDRDTSTMLVNVSGEGAEAGRTIHCLAARARIKELEKEPMHMGN